MAARRLYLVRWLPRRFPIAILVIALSPLAAVANDAEALFRKGRRAQSQGRHIEAYLLYSRARALDPANPSYIRAARGVRRGAAQLLAAAGEHRTALEMAPDSWEFHSIDADDREPVRKAAISVSQDQPAPSAPKKLRFSDHETSFRFRGTLREAYLEAAEEFGIRIVFDEGFDDDTPIRADLTECDFRCAMRALGEIGTVLVVPLDDDLLFVAEDTASTRSEFESTALASIPLASALTPDEISEVSQAIQQVLDVKRLQALSSGGLFLRDSVTKVNMARLLAQGLLHPRGVAQIDLQMVTVSRSGDIRAGIDLPTTFPVANLSAVLGAAPDASGTDRLIGLGGGKTVLGVTLGDASLIARLNASSAQNIHSLYVRSAHGMPAEFKIGERYPIATAQYSSGAAGSAGQRVGNGSYIQPAPSISFEDLGLNLAVTPLIHSALDVSLQLEVSFRFLAGRAVNDIPVLANREFRSQVRLRRGNFAIVSGMTVYERRRSGRGLSGLGQIPWLGSLFRRNERRWSQRDLLILVRPRVVRLPPGELARIPEFLFGTEQRALPTL